MKEWIVLGYGKAKDATRDLAIFKESLSFVAGGSRGHQ